ncbi:MAG: hypothetical protein ABI591_11745 [Kofleriaceae bacterium]
MKTIGTLSFHIAGPGLVIYSPFAMADVASGTHFLEERFSEMEDVGAFIRAGTLAGFNMGSPGTYHLDLQLGVLDVPNIAAYPWWIRLALEVRDQTVCVRDLYDFSRWKPACPKAQTFTIPNGYYRLAVGTRPSDSEIVGDDQDIMVVFEPVLELPALTWESVPFLGDESAFDDEA